MSDSHEDYCEVLRPSNTALEEIQEQRVAARGAAEEDDLEACVVALEAAIRALGKQVGVGLARHLVVAVLDLTFAGEHATKRRRSQL